MRVFFMVSIFVTTATSPCVTFAVRAPAVSPSSQSVSYEPRYSKSHIALAQITDYTEVGKLTCSPPYTSSRKQTPA